MLLPLVAARASSVSRARAIEKLTRNRRKGDGGQRNFPTYGQL
ncbi:hypothetical protein RB200_05860 [Streptomyces sp. PmtG]